MQSTRFIRKVFVTKILLSGKFSFFSDSGDDSYWEIIREHKNKENNNDNDDDKDNHTDEVPETPIICNVFEILMTHSFQI